MTIFLSMKGSEGEFYFDPNKPAVLKGLAASNGKKLVVPIFPHSNALLPLSTGSVCLITLVELFLKSNLQLSTEWLNIFEMRHRQLIHDVGDGYFGFSHFSQNNRKLSLVGTLACVKDRKLMNDGRTFVIIEGVKRFYITDFISEKPYIKARVQTFEDYSERPDMVDDLEQKIFIEVRMNIKVPFKTIFPFSKYSIYCILYIHSSLLHVQIFPHYFKHAQAMA